MSDNAPEEDETPGLPGVIRFYLVMFTGFMGFIVGAVAHIVLG